MEAKNLRTAIGTYGHTVSLKDNTAHSPRFTMDHVEISPVPMIFRRMVRDLEFDVAEMAFATYIVSKYFEKPFTALPIFLTRSFYHRSVSCRAESSFESPKELEGKRIGIRSYTFTPGVWTRGILKTEYGVDLDSITWVLSGDEHVAEFKAPSNVVSSPTVDLEKMLLSGEVDAVIGAGNLDHQRTRPLFPDHSELDATWFGKTMIYPISHVLVVKDTLLECGDSLVQEIYRVFNDAKESYLQSLETKHPLTTDDLDVLRMRDIVSSDPLPYGVGGDREGIKVFIDFCIDQKLLPRLMEPEELFPLRIC